MNEDISLGVAIRALQRLYRAFTGRDLPEVDARRLIEQTRTETE